MKFINQIICNRMSSDRETRALAGILNDPGKNREMAGRKKEGKSGNFHSIILNLKKKNFEVRICLFFI